MVIHIISGDTMNEYSGELGFGGHVVVMNEEMMSGSTHQDIFSQEFINVRSKFLGIHADKYKKRIALPFLRCVRVTKFTSGSEKTCSVR